MRSLGKIIVNFLYPSDKVMLCSDGQLTQTKIRINTAKVNAKASESTDAFLRTIKAIPKGSILVVSQVYIKGRAQDLENHATVSVADGPLHKLYMEHVVDKEITELKVDISQREQKASSLPPATKKESLIDIRNMKKKLQTLESNRQRAGFTKLLKIAIKDIETWDLKLIADDS